MYPQSTSWEEELRTGIVEFEKRYRGADYSPDDVVIGPGVAGVLSVLHYAILEEGDEVISVDPSHYLTGPTIYWPYIGAKVVPCRTLEFENWKPDLDEMKKKITSRTKAIFVNNPNNPTGAVYDDKTLRGIVNMAGQNNIPVISDEIYGLITYDDVKAASVSSLAREVPVIMLSGMSKVFMRTGWRVGYMCIHDPNDQLKDVTEVIKKVSKMYGQGSTCIPTPILVAAAKSYRYAVDHGIREIDSMIRELQVRRDYTIRRFLQIGGVSCDKPKGALYAFPRIKGIGELWANDIDFLIDLLKEEGVVFDPGSSYGRFGGSHFRTLIMPKIEILENVYNRLEGFMRKRGVS